MRVWRYNFILVLFGLLCLVVAARLLMLGTIESVDLQSRGDDRALRAVEIPAQRGRVYDRAGEVLADNLDVYDVWVDPSDDRLSEEVVERLSDSLDLGTDLPSRIARNRVKRFLYLKRQVEPKVVARLREFERYGVQFSPIQKRFYPLGEATSHVVGILNIDGVAQEGVELAYDARLRGTPGRMQVQRDGKGRMVRQVSSSTPAQQGNSLHLTLDSRLQLLAVRELKALTERFDIAVASLIAIDPTSGGVRVMLNQPSYDPNDRSELKVLSLRNRAVTDVYEPGLVLAPFTLIAALESGKFQPDSTIDTTPGLIKIGRYEITDSVNHGVLSFDQLLQSHSNVALTKIAQVLPLSALHNTLRKVGIGVVPESGLPGEVPGMVDDPGTNPTDSERILEQTGMARGYGLNATLLHLTAAYTVLAKGGVRIPVTTDNGMPPQGERVFSAPSVKAVLAQLEITESSRWKAARVPGYRVAGLGSVSDIAVSGGYSKEDRNVFFLGLAPIAEPKLVVGLIANRVPVANLAGVAEAVGAVFAQFMNGALPLMGTGVR